MTSTVALFTFIAFYVFAFFSDQLSIKTRRALLVISCIILTFMVGLRNPSVWSDTLVYLIGFKQTPSIFDLTADSKPFGYVEMGFYYIGVLIKTFTNSSIVYFTVISALSFFFIYKSLNKYSIYPLLGLAVYLARFYTGRNMTQIRACLAIAIVVYFTFYIYKKKWWHYLFVVIISYTLHQSAMVALPMLLLRNYRIRREYIYIGIGISLLVAGSMGGVVKDWVQSSGFMQDMGGSYVQEGSDKAYANTLANPVIWYQIFILFSYTHYEKQLKQLSPYYYIMRNGYFYCTCILIIMCQYAIVAARTSTLFATFEIAIIPMLVNMWGKKNRVGIYVVFGMACIALFYLNWSPHYNS